MSKSRGDIISARLTQEMQDYIDETYDAEESRLSMARIFNTGDKVFYRSEDFAEHLKAVYAAEFGDSNIASLASIVNSYLRARGKVLKRSPNRKGHRLTPRVRRVRKTRMQSRESVPSPGQMLEQLRSIPNGATHYLVWNSGVLFFFSGMEA